MKKFQIVTFGCKCNQIESQKFRDQMKNLGWEENENFPDVIVMNTCSVTQKAHQKSLSAFRKLLKQFPDAFFAITGCASSLSPESFQNFSKGKVVSNLLKENLLLECFDEKVSSDFTLSGFEGHTRAFVKIQDGCDRFCSYCVIPFVRGRSRSRSEEEILQEIDCLTKRGFSEIVLTGINLGDYHFGLFSLLQKIEVHPLIQRIRLSSLEPEHLSKELIDLLTSSEKFANSLHLSIQSGSKSVLKRMGRLTEPLKILELLDYARNRDEKFTFSSDFIIGFPAETENEFLETLDFVKKAFFVKVHLFSFSLRPLTQATQMKNFLKKEEIMERKKRFEFLTQELGRSLRKAFIGTREKILLEETKLENFYSGYSRNYLKVFIPRENGLKVGDWIRVELFQEFLEKEALIGKRV